MFTKFKNAKQKAAGMIRKGAKAKGKFELFKKGGEKMEEKKEEIKEQKGDNY
jgi:hypothetical protein